MWIMNAVIRGREHGPVRSDTGSQKLVTVSQAVAAPVFPLCSPFDKKKKKRRRKEKTHGEESDTVSLWDTVPVRRWFPSVRRASSMSQPLLRRSAVSQSILGADSTAYLSLWIRGQWSLSRICPPRVLPRCPLVDGQHAEQRGRGGGRSGVRTTLWFSRGDCFSSHPSLPPLYKQRSGRTQTSPPPYWPVAELETGRSQSERGNVTCVYFSILGNRKCWGNSCGNVWTRLKWGEHKNIYYITFNYVAK